MIQTKTERQQKIMSPETYSDDEAVRFDAALSSEKRNPLSFEQKFEEIDNLNLRKQASGDVGSRQIVPIYQVNERSSCSQGRKRKSV